MGEEIQSAEVTIHYTDDGVGAPVLLVHGYTGAAQMWNDTGTTAALRDRFRVIALDCRGHGHSGKPHGASSYRREMVDDLVRLLDELALDRVGAVGYSMGAELALRLAVEHPERVGSLVVGGSGWSGVPDTENYQRLADSLDESASFGPVFRAMTPPGQPEPTAEQIAAMDRMLEGQDIAALVGVARGMADIINLTTREVSEIAVPVLGIAGEHDPERGNLEKLQGVLPDYTLRILAGCDHMSAMTDPQFNPLIAEFLLASQ